MKLPSAPKIFGRRKGAGVAERDMARSRKLVLVPLAAIMVASVLAVAPLSTSGVPVLSALEAEPADAHDPLVTIPVPRTVCRDVIQERNCRVLPSLGTKSTRSVLLWFTVGSRNAVTEYYYVTIVHPHSHGFREECAWMTVAANVATLGLLTRIFGNSVLVWVCHLLAYLGIVSAGDDPCTTHSVQGCIQERNCRVLPSLGTKSTRSVHLWLPLGRGMRYGVLLRHYCSSTQPRLPRRMRVDDRCRQRRNIRSAYSHIWE